MSGSDILTAVSAYYTGRLAEHGSTPAGVDWNGEAGQVRRFDELLRILERTSRPYTLLDIGCGYGALVDRLAARGDDFRYVGYDIAPAMVGAARERHAGEPRAAFTSDFAALPTADFAVASGIFSVRLDTSAERWQTHMELTLERMARLSRLGFAFNALTSHADPERRRDDLYYADPAAVLDHCLRRFSRDVALRHDYDLYEFTVLVRMDGRGPAEPTEATP